MNYYCYSGASAADWGFPSVLLPVKNNLGVIDPSIDLAWYGDLFGAKPKSKCFIGASSKAILLYAEHGREIVAALDWFQLVPATFQFGEVPLPDREFQPEICALFPKFSAEILLEPSRAPSYKLEGYKLGGSFSISPHRKNFSVNPHWTLDAGFTKPPFPYTIVSEKCKNAFEALGFNNGEYILLDECSTHI